MPLVAGRTGRNVRVLYQICRKAHPNTRFDGAEEMIRVPAPGA